MKATLPGTRTGVDNEVQSLARALQILRAFRTGKSEQSLGELAQAVTLNKSTTHRLLATLERYQFIERNPETAAYRLGIALFELGMVVQHKLDLRERARPSMLALAELTEETVSLCVVDNNEALCIERVSGSSPIQVLALDVGGRLPLNAGAAPRVLLAHMDDGAFHRLMTGWDFPRYTAHTLTEPDILTADRSAVRSNGYCVSQGDVLPDVIAIGAPIYDATGNVVASVSIVGIAARFTPERQQDYVVQVRAAAQRVSQRLGYFGEPSAHEHH